MSLDPHTSVRQIRRRLLRLLLQAFGTIVALMVVLILIVFVLAVNGFATGNDPFQPLQTRALEAYYQGRGSWEGVAAVARGDTWQSAIVLDSQGCVVLDRGRADTALVGQPFTGQPDFPAVNVPLVVEGRAVGTLLINIPDRLEAVRVALGLLTPVFVVSFFLAALTVLIGYLLAQRFINPLSDVIAAAQAVAGGDLTTRVPVEGPGDLRSLSDSFNRMTDALERSDRERRAALTDIAHELRTPLTVMRGRLEGFVDGVYPLDEAHLAPVLEETYQLERLVEDLRTLTLAEARQLHFDRRPTDLGELAQRAVGVFDAEARERALTLAVSVAPGLPAVTADPQRVSQVIGNLLGNALRYVPENGQVTVSVARAPGGVELAVSDTGPGVPEADLPHLFDRFWRGEKSRARASGGAGLGLAIARQLIEAQGGTLTARNRPEGGLVVSFVMK